MRIFYETSSLDGMAAAVFRHGFPDCDIVPVTDSFNFPWHMDLMSRKLVVLGLPNVAKTMADQWGDYFDNERTGQSGDAQG